MTLKYILLVFLMFFSCACFSSQDSSIKASIKELKSETNDAVKVQIMGKLSFVYQYVDFTRSLYYSTEALKLAKRINYPRGIAKSYNFIGLSYSSIGKLDKALQNYLAALNANKKAGIEDETPKNLNNIAEVLLKMGDVENAKKYIAQAYSLNQKYKNKKSTSISLMLMARIYSAQNIHSKALTHLYDAKETAEGVIGIFDEGFFNTELGDIYLRAGIVDSAEIAFKKVLKFEPAEPDQVITAYYGLATLAKDKGSFNESKMFFDKALVIANQSNAQFELIKIYEGLSNLSLLMKDYKSTINYMSKKDTLKDALLGYQTSGKIISDLNSIITEQKDLENDVLRMDAVVKENELSKQKIILIILLGGITVSVCLGFIAFSNFKKRNKAYAKLHEANLIIKKHNANLEETVATRTDTIFLKNKKLKELAYFNSHKLRKHLANILGLIFLLKDEGEKKEYLNLLESEAQSLDATINQINKMIDD
ncbi:tetratricopeptide repeat protein [Pedobacter cryophilus]|uniref:histidine kinase n=1 Tax=Pedobacter cryophilus TaxID=2571271 RepID=A0A4U1C9M9_9SPHI|nr:tetratricopeptide repeat protein [Pedobacter cryophilus]TKC00358.1 tetratricopeptide repeat protein [Pedobacter cryophilus]